MGEQACMDCKEIHNRNDLQWVNDNYGFPWKKVCEDYYDEIGEVCGNISMRIH